MGSFNTSCFVTQQIIKPDDAVVLFPIFQEKGGAVDVVPDPGQPLITASHPQFTSSTCHQTAFWEYGGPTLEATYADYGRFTLLNTPQNIAHLTSFFESLHSNLCEVKPGDNDCHDHPLRFRDLFDPIKTYSFAELSEIWETLSEMIHESRLFVRKLGYVNDIRPLAFAVVHTSTFRHTIDLYESFEDFRKTKQTLRKAVCAALEEAWSDGVALLNSKSSSRFFHRTWERSDFLPCGDEFHLDLHYPLGDVDLFQSLFSCATSEQAVDVFFTHRRGLCEHLYFTSGLALTGAHHPSRVRGAGLRQRRWKPLSSIGSTRQCRRERTDYPR
jgi:hypothetical protein